jgi:hypothetical protein
VSVNKYQPHVMVLPEDDANRQIANGFVLEVNPDRMRRIQVLPEAGGWNEVLSKFESEHVAEMGECQERLMVLVLDLDGNLERLTTARNRIPQQLRDRVFVIGARTKPEELRQSLGISFELIGQAIANDCRDDQSATWGHALLLHNADEVQRLRQAVRPLLFS